MLFSLLPLLQPSEQWRLIRPGGEVEAVQGRPKAIDAEPAQVQSAWVWTSHLAPRRIEPAAIDRFRLPAADPFLAVQVIRRGAGKPPADLRLVAAPQEMWLAVPEASLPGWPVPQDGRLSIPVDPGKAWRLRVVGSREGSWWVDVPAGRTGALVTVLPAAGIDLAVLDAGGKPARPVQGFVQEAVARSGGAGFWAYLWEPAGRIALPGLPDEREVSLTLRSATTAPLVLRGRPGSLPRQVTLRDGAELRGRLTTLQGTPLAGVPVEAEAFATRDLPQVHVVKGESDGEGRWRLPGLPAGRVALSLRPQGFVPRSEILDLEPGTRDLGTWKLEPGVEIAVAVVDERGIPVAGAEVRAAGGRVTATADGRGLARLSGLPRAPVQLEGRAERHLPGSLRLNPPFPEPGKLVLPRGLTVTGRLVEAAGAAVGQGSVRVVSGNSRKEMALDPGGRFDLTVSPGSPGDLSLRSPATPELRLHLAAGVAGEVRDLGDLRAPAGLVVTGRVVRAEDGQPLPGATIWVPRQGPEGPAVAWATRDLLQASSAGDGRFRLSGLQIAPADLRIDAPGHARYQAAVPLPDPGADGPVDLGDLALSAGVTLRVQVVAPGVDLEGAVARADLGNRWLDPDLLTAAVHEGEAVLPHVPAGPVTVSVLAGDRLVCERPVAVPAEGELAVDCRRARLAVSGRVLVGGVPAGGGMLHWKLPGAAVPARIDTLVSPAGLRQQQVAGLGRPQVHVAVEADGRFETADLTPGRWLVTRSAELDMAGAPLTVEIPPGESFVTDLHFAGLALAGTVTDEAGKPAEAARVRELTGGALSFTDSRGSFTLNGLKPGKALVQAQREAETSAVQEVELQEEGATEPVRLVLGDHESPRLSIQVADAAGGPAAGAFVFLEEEGKGLRLLTAAADGKATATLEAPLAARVRVAALVSGRWGLGAWVSREAAVQGLSLAVGGGSSLRVQTRDKRGIPRILHETGWDLTWMLRLLASPLSLSPDQPLQLAGLPPGRYAVSLGGSSTTVQVGESEGGEGRLE